MADQMPVQFERIIFKSDGSLHANIPTPIAKALEVDEGDGLTIWLNYSQIIMIKTKKTK